MDGAVEDIGALQHPRQRDARHAVDFGRVDDEDSAGAPLFVLVDSRLDAARIARDGGQAELFDGSTDEAIGFGGREISGLDELDAAGVGAARQRPEGLVAIGEPRSERHVFAFVS